MTEPILVHDVDSVRTITLNRPERLNALDLEDRRKLVVALRDAERDESCRAVVIAGSGKIFCSGGDIKSMPTGDRAMAHERLRAASELGRQLVRSRTPIVAAVEGGAFGLGLSMASAVDVVVASDDSKYCASFGKIGLIADTGLFYTLPRRVGAGVARRMLLTAETISVDEALQIGLVHEVVPTGHSHDQAMKVASRLTELSAPAIAATRDILSRPNQDLDSVLEVESAAQVGLLSGPDFLEGRAAFLEHRTPKFTGV